MAVIVGRVVVVVALAAFGVRAVVLLAVLIIP